MDANVSQLLDLILNAITLIILIAGLLYGAYQLWNGFTDDQPQAKKHGLTILIVTVVVVVLIQSIKPIFVNMAGGTEAMAIFTPFLI